MKDKGQTVWDMKQLSKAPATYSAEGFEPLGDKDPMYGGIIHTPELKKADAENHSVKAMFYDGVPFRGKPTRVFAWYGLPKMTKGQKVPAMVLIHGGGGTAFESWVRLWNARGYAAIAMDTCGSVPKGTYSNWERHEYGGPAGWGGADQIDWPISDQWTYHAIADVILANSLLRSFPEIDKNKIGVTGVSWGGYLTSIIVGVDNRLKFAVPVYGCGFFMDGAMWQGFLGSMGKEKGACWAKQWDPSVYLKYAKMPILWVNGTNDFAFFMDIWQESYRATKGPHTLCLRVNMPHGHGGASENPEEIHTFANYFCKDGDPLAKIGKQGQSKGKVLAKYESAVPIKSVELNFTKDSGNWPDRKWETIPAQVEEDRVTAQLPDGVEVYYMNLIDNRGNIISTEHVEIPSAVEQK
ncbi:MAG: alpha/beta hydrolase family protein [Armatimonadota bacterium]